MKKECILCGNANANELEDYELEEGQGYICIEGYGCHK
jgi:hypothetical protein